MHAISEARLKKDSLVDKAITMAGDIFESISIYLPGVPIPPMDEVKKIVAAGYLPWLNYDLLFGKQDLNFPYIGITDFQERATVTPNLY